jgi:protein tyrosine/serine phosphatase
MSARLRWTFGVGIACLVLLVPAVFYRWEYTHSKRLREIVPGRVYRCGQLTTEGFAEAVERLHIRTVINLQDDFPDPDIYTGYFTTRTIRESELCRRLGVRFMFIAPELLPRRMVPEHRPKAIDQFLAVMDDPANWPVLFHCHAGLHRTGVMAAVYRMEYGGWSRRDAMIELRANGFGEWPSTSANDYITQFVLTYRPGIREQSAVAHAR